MAGLTPLNHKGETTMRITRKVLDRLAKQLNVLTEAPKSAWVNGEAQIGHYYIDGAYGGYSLYRVVNKSGGAMDVFDCGHVPARDLYNRIRAYMRGFCDGQKVVK